MNVKLDAKIYMPNIPALLYTIQSFELAIDQARSRLESIDELLANDAQVAAAQAAHDTSLDTLQKLNAQVKNLELELAGLVQKISDVDTLLYSGQLQNPKELQERQSEFDSLKRRQQNLEIELLENGESLKLAQVEQEETDQQLKDAIIERDKTHVDLIAEKKNLDSQIHQNLKLRKESLQNVSESVLKDYRKLRKQHRNGYAVALIDDITCSVCRIEQPTSEIQRILQGDEFVYCVGCGRLLASH